MRTKVHFIDCDDNKVGEWNTTDHILDIQLNDRVQVSGKLFQVVARRPVLVGMPYGAYDRLIVVFPLDSPDA
jgi:hypothetical protein